MFLTKLNNQYTAKEDKIALSIGLPLLSLIPSWVGVVMTNNNYSWFLFPAILFFGYFLFVTLQHFTHKSNIKGVQRDFTELVRIIESKKLSSNSSALEIKRREDDFYVDYEFNYGPWSGHVAKFVYNREQNTISGNYLYEDARKYCKEQGNAILESLKEMILEHENKDKPILKHPEVIEDNVENQDEIVQKINEVMKFSHIIVRKNDSLLSLEDKHILVSSIPADLKELKDVYLSFSDESKESNKENIKRTMSVLEERIMSISMNMERIKEEKLELLEQKIVKKHSS